MLIHKPIVSSSALLVLFALAACNNEENPSITTSEVVLKNQSVTPVLAKKQAGFESLEIFSLISSDDKLDQSPGYIFGGSADGTGILKNTDGTYMMLVNNEDNFAVSRLTLDKTFKPVKGEYLLNSDGGIWRLCSATMATPEIHGFGPKFLTCGESGQESRTHALDPYGSVGSASLSKEVAGLGRWSAENAVPLPKTAFSGKTIILIGDDDSDTYGGQVAMYVSNTVGDLENGTLYMMKRTDGNQKEMDMKTGTKYPVEFARIDDHKTLTGDQINRKVNDLKAIKFGRVEDVDYGKGSDASKAREVYFTVTGQATTGVNADYSRSKYGRVYKLTLDAADPTKGSLELLLDGDDRNGIAKTFQDPDNITVTENYAYIQEDPNGYGDETHDSYLYQYSFKTGELKPVLMIDHRRTEADAAKYNVGGTSAKGAWEISGMIDISDVIGVPNTFSVGLQAHSWRDDKYKKVDGGSKRPDENQGSQLVIIKGLAR
ncbi:hypothetical protein [Spirosoma endbachense]|uniref:DUF839 domain-containing protein n=1 Tax=Spirosoma endbachense TaxID=2666025 RepID=A0A6P1VYQ3_9BACT|nr:hypothetical protein [Spirosoma endbachense]QHV97754.1 hypothetical protein GJR95_23305 [Spirosoma endbachense]